MDNLPKDKSVYIHTLIFSKNNGIDNIYAYFPDPKILLGYIQYSFLQEAFYKWIYGKKRMVTKIPGISVEKIVKGGLERGLITNDTAKVMLNHYKKVVKMWDLPKNRVLPELTKFCREFNRAWFGNNQEFIYMKVFKTPIELCDFVVESACITNDEKDFQEKIGMSVDEWRDLCRNLFKDSKYGQKFREILQKCLTEVI